MYGAEVPAYTTLVDVSHEVNRDLLAKDAEQAQRLGDIDRVTAERHGAIRVGTPEELRQVGQIFAALGMHPVGFYDLREAAASAVPVVSTAFRPIDPGELARNPFRVFTSLVRLELLEDLVRRADVLVENYRPDVKTRLGIDYYDRELPGHVSARVVNDLDVILNFLQSSVFNMLTRLAQSVIGILLITVIAPPATPIILGFLVLMAIATAIHLPINAKALEWGRTELGNVVAIFEEDYTGRREIRSYGAVDHRAERFRDACWELRRARRWAKIVEGAYGSILQFGSAALPAIVLYRTGDLVLAGSLSVGAALAVRLLSSTATVPLTVS
jgi:ABC-type multidrug transport system fused ATPase/permease subunit